MSDLFRDQALAFRGRQGDGEPRLVRPPASSLLCLLLVSTLLAAFSFLATNDYARKATVTGHVDVTGKIKPIYSPKSSVVAQVLVTEGDRIGKGDEVARFNVVSAIDEKERKAVMAEFDTQLSAIAARTSALQKRQRNDIDAIEADIQNAHASIGKKLSILLLQEEKIAQLEATQDAARPLFEAGKLSRIEWGRFRERFLSANQEAEQLRAAITAERAEITRLRFRVESLQSDVSNRVAALRQEAAAIRQQQRIMAADQSYILRAPSTGIVSRVHVTDGEQTDPSRPIISLAPADATTFVRLLVPTRSAGFIAPGQPVNLLYDAFPYQQFGTYRGTLVDVSPHALATGSDSAPPVFEAKVALERPTVDAYGEEVPLRPGMTLKADVVLDRRTLFEWMIEPIMVMRGRGA